MFTVYFKKADHPLCPVVKSLSKYAQELFHSQSTDTVSIELLESSGRNLQLSNIPLQDVTGELVRMGGVSVRVAHWPTSQKSS